MQVREYELEFVHFDAPQAIRDARRGIPPFQYTGKIDLVKCFTDIEEHTVKRIFESRTELGYYIRLERLRNLELNKGEVIRVSKRGKVIIEPVISDYTGQLNIHPNDFKLLTGDSALINDMGRVIISGDFDNLRQLALKYVVDGKFEYNYYIISKSRKSTYLITGKYEMVDSNVNLRSSSKRLILPLYRFILYGYITPHSVI